MSRLIFVSTLGHRVEHQVCKLNSDCFETTSGSRLRLKVLNGSVYLTAGRAKLITGNHWRVSEVPHFYEPPVLLGQGSMEMQ